MISRALASLGPAALALTSSQADQAVLPSDSDSAQPEVESEDPEGLVEYEGMLVSASAAQRRRWAAQLQIWSVLLHQSLVIAQVSDCMRNSLTVCVDCVCHGLCVLPYPGIRHRYAVFSDRYCEWQDTVSNMLRAITVI